MVQPALGKTVLVVEDEALARNILVKKLISSGFSVKEAVNGQDAVAEVQKYKPDLILLDLLMPVMDGQTFLRELRGIPGCSEIPVIILSNLITPENVMSAFDRKVVDYLLKTNVGLDSIVSKIKTALNIPE